MYTKWLINPLSLPTVHPLSSHGHTLQFHTHCVDGILENSNCCPLDGYVIYNPLTWKQDERKTPPKLALSLSYGCAKRAENNLEDLFVPGVAIRAKNQKPAPSHGSLSLEMLTDSSENISQRSLRNQLVGLCLTTTDVKTKTQHNVFQKKQREGFSESSLINHPNKPDTVDGQNACSSGKTAAKCTSASPAVFVPVKQIREQQQVNLFIGLSPQPVKRATTSFPPRRTRLQPKDTNNKLTSALKMTGDLMNAQQ